MRKKRKIAYCLFGDPVDPQTSIKNLFDKVRNIEDIDFYIQCTANTNTPIALPKVMALETSSLNQDIEFWMTKFKSLPSMQDWPLSQNLLQNLLSIDRITSLRDTFSQGRTYDLTVFAHWNTVYNQKISFDDFFPIEGLHFSRQMVHYAPTLMWFMTTELHMPHLRLLTQSLYNWCSQRDSVDWNFGIIVKNFFESQGVVCHHRPCAIHLLSKPLPFDKKLLYKLLHKY